VNKVQIGQTPSAAVEMPVDEGIILTAPTDIARAWPGTTIRAAKWILKKLRALAPRGAGLQDTFSVRAPDAGLQDIISVGYYPTEKVSSNPMHAALYQRRRGRGQKLCLVIFDPSRVPDLRAKLEVLLKAVITKLLHILRPGDIEPLGGNGKVAVDATVVPAKLPWSMPVVEEVTDPAEAAAIRAQIAVQDELAAIRVRIAANDPLEDHAQVMADLRTLALLLPPSLTN
jgi:hypothetical protein